MSDGKHEQKQQQFAHLFLGEKVSEMFALSSRMLYACIRVSATTNRLDIQNSL